jgi:hypothetical protein
VAVHLEGIAALKAGLEKLTVVEKELALLKKDVESLGKWKEDLKKERDESARRLWAFGPNALAAIISGFISLTVALLVAWLTKRP